MKELWSIFTNNMNRCIYTGYEDPINTPYPQIERHHVFGGISSHRKASEKRGFIAPLRRDIHPNGVHAQKGWQKTDLDLKQRCQRYYEEHYGTREEFMDEFGGNFL